MLFLCESHSKLYTAFKIYPFTEYLFSDNKSNISHAISNDILYKRHLIFELFNFMLY